MFCCMKSDTNWINLETQYLAIKKCVHWKKICLLVCKDKWRIKLCVFVPKIIVEWMWPQLRIQEVPTYRSLGWLTNFHKLSRWFWKAAVLPRRATGHLDTGFSRFPCAYKQMLRWFPRFQVATTCYSCSPPDLGVFTIYTCCKISNLSRVYCW